MHRKTSEPSFIDVLVTDHIGRNSLTRKSPLNRNRPSYAKVSFWRPLHNFRRPVGSRFRGQGTYVERSGASRRMDCRLGGNPWQVMQMSPSGRGQPRSGG